VELNYGTKVGSYKVIENQKNQLPRNLEFGVGKRENLNPNLNPNPKLKPKLKPNQKVKIKVKIKVEVNRKIKRNQNRNDFLVQILIL
jgi:hypothetical protein